MWQAKQDQQFRIVNKHDTHADIWLYDEIGVWGVTAKSFAEELKEAGDVSSITLRLNSPGGDVFDGLAIYNTLKRHPASVNVEIDGVAASIASIIAMAGDVAISPNAMMMIHDPWTIAMGGAEDFRKTADLLEQIKGSLISTYRTKTDKSVAEIAAAMADETWFEAQEAIDFGLADSMTEAAPIAAADVSKFRAELVGQYGNRRAPEEGTPERSKWIESREYAIKLAGVT